MEILYAIGFIIIGTLIFIQSYRDSRFRARLAVLGSICLIFAGIVFFTIWIGGK